MNRKTADTITDADLDALYAEREGIERTGMEWMHKAQQTDAAAAQLEVERDGAYRERTRLLAWIAATLPAGSAVLAEAPDVGVPGWRILFLRVRGRQLSWHIAPADAPLLADVEQVGPDDPRAKWDGHSTPEKYRRIAELVAELHSTCGPECAEGHTYAGRCEGAPPNAQPV